MNWNYIILLLLTFGQVRGQSPVPVWQPDNQNGTYRNPVIHADYSDPDAIRVGDDFYMIASSFNAAPGLPILHSKDLVNWTIIGHALDRQLPEEAFSKVQHGNGVWAPSIRYHNKTFYIYYPDPDRGIFLTKAVNITGPWSRPILVECGRGLIDPCPLWDDNGKVYLVHAYAGSRAGIKSILVIKEINAEGDSVIGQPVLVYDGHATDPTIEGPKLYKRKHFYYIFAPAGGVSNGWQLVLRSKNIYGPYERRVVMDQGSSPVNGPHQGAWVNTSNGEDWFLHFQDKKAYGRVVHLQPMLWENDWPVIGSDNNKDGKGEPVMVFKKPSIAHGDSITTPQTSDEFDQAAIGLQWQWQANPRSDWAFPTSTGSLRMYCIPVTDSLENDWTLPNMLVQKLPAEAFTVVTKFRFDGSNVNDRMAMIVFGTDYAFVSVVKKPDGNYISFNNCLDAGHGKPEHEILIKKWVGGDIYFRVIVDTGAVCYFGFSEDGKSFENISQSFTAKPGKWVGARLGLFCSGTATSNDSGYADIDWIHFTKS